MHKSVKHYLSSIGRKGGKISKRTLTTEQARSMVLVREAARAYRKFHTRCFWSFDPHYKVQKTDIPWVVEQLRKNGGPEAWEVASKLCL